MTATFAVTPRTTVRRLPDRASYERDAANAILDEALVCHVGFALDGQPFVIPTTFGREGDELFLHGSAASRMLRSLRGGLPVCVTVTLLDGLVLARSSFHHSMNYRSVVVLGTAEQVTDEAAKRAALDVIVEHVLPGRVVEVRAPTDVELKGTMVLRVPLEEASVKVRTGPPVDDEDDLTPPSWGGVLPLRLTAGEPRPDEFTPAGFAHPASLTARQASF
jgi:hypothetical protein